MRNFILGIVITILVLLIGGLGLALLGFLPTRANSAPPPMESHIAMSALDNSVERHAPRMNNPVPPTDENLIEGLKIYTMNCALCHGGIDRQPSTLGEILLSPASEPHPSPAGRSGMARLLRDSHWRPLYGHARLGQDAL